MSYYILPYQELFKLCEAELINVPEYADRLQPASVDLPISDMVFELSSVFIPWGISDVFAYVTNEDLIQDSCVIPEYGFTLLTDRIYLIKLNAHLFLPPHLFGEIQTRSSAGRNDVSVSVLQQFNPQAFHTIDAGYRGGLWMVVIPQSYPITIFPGDSFAQMRVLDQRQSYTPAMPSYLSIDLTPDENNVSIYRSWRQTDPDDYPVTFNSYKYYSPVGYWGKMLADIQSNSVWLYPGHLYIARSVEHVVVSPAHAMDLIAYSPAIGEFKTHYAGFFDPGFGVHQPTRAVFEIRVTHPLYVTHGQRIAQTQYLRLLQETDHPYVGTYQGQGLRLGKQFREPQD